MVVSATEQHRDGIKDLLRSQHLPFEDLPASLEHFFVVLEDGDLIGTIGMEQYEGYGLLRSMVVHPGHRNKGLAENLVARLEQEALATGITGMFLLTETAEKYFSRKGYDVVHRDEVPSVLKQSSEFSHVCPASAIVMKKQLSVQNEVTSMQ